MSLKPAALESPHLQKGRPILNDPEIQVLHTPMDLPAMQSHQLIVITTTTLELTTFYFLYIYNVAV